jgi:hypothetical protein
MKRMQTMMGALLGGAMVMGALALPPSPQTSQNG